MNETPDPLEAELAALRPQEASPDIRRRIAEGLAQAPPTRRRWRWSFALAAASLAAVAIWWNFNRPRMETPADVQPLPAPLIAEVDEGPTLRAYQRALARSPEALQALLDEHAKRFHRVAAPRRGFFTTNADFQAMLGDN